MQIASPRLYFRDYFVFVPLLLALGIGVFMWLYTLAKIPVSNERVYLHYNIIFGIDQYGSRSMLYYPLVFSLGVFVFNGIGSFFLYKYDRVIARMITLGTLVITIFFLVGILLTVGLNI